MSSFGEINVMATTLDSWAGDGYHELTEEVIFIVRKI